MAVLNPTSSELVTVAVGPRAGGVPVQEVTTFGSVGINLDYSRGDQVQFSCDGRSAEAGFIDELATDVWVTGRIEQRFRITQVGQAWDADGGDVIQVLAVSYKRLLNSRHIGPGGLTFTNVDQGDIVWGLINHTQTRPGGSLGVSKGASTTGTTRVRQYVEGDNIGKLAEDLQNVIGGLWWDIGPTLVYTAKSQASFPTRVTPLQLGATVRAMSRESNADIFANVAYGDAAEGTTPVWAESASITTDPRGRWEAAYGWPTVKDQATLVEHTNGELAQAQSPLSSWRIDLEPERWTGDVAFLPGDFCRLVVPPSTAAPVGPGAGGTILVQVSQSSVSIDADGAVSLNMAVTEVPG